jgi:hypothetical protein
MPLTLPLNTYDRPDDIEDFDVWRAGIEAEMPHNLKIANPVGSPSVINGTSYASYGDIVQNVFTGQPGANRAIIQIGYRALWFNSSNTNGTFNAAIFIDGQQLRKIQPGVANGGIAPTYEIAQAYTVGNTGLQHLMSDGGGLFTQAATATSASNVTTGQIVGGSAPAFGGVCACSIPTPSAFPFNVEIRYKVASAAQPITIQDRVLWVRAFTYMY